MRTLPILLLLAASAFGALDARHVEFRILAEAGPEYADRNEALRTDLARGGPQSDSADLRWFEIADPPAFFRLDDPAELATRTPEQIAGSLGLVAGTHDGAWYVLAERDDARRMVLLDADSQDDGKLTNVRVDHDPREKLCIVFNLTEAGGAELGRLTGDHLGRSMAVLVDGQAFSHARIQGRIADGGIISGDFGEARLRQIFEGLASALPPRPAAEHAAAVEQERARLRSTASPGEARSPAPQLATGFLYREVIYNGERYPYAVFVPPTYDPAKAWPIILFLHGSGERGDDGFKQTEVGLGRAIRRNVDRCQAVVVFPQCPDMGMWTGANLEMAKACVQETANAYHLDPRRFYVTGLSMGGGGTWEIAAHMRDKVAAIVPVCGFVDRWRETPAPERVEAIAEALKHMPTWLFHGDADRAVHVSHSRAMAEALKQRGANVTYTEYEGGKHNVWDRAYEQREFWAWLFSQRLPEGGHKLEPAPPLATQPINLKD